MGKVTCWGSQVPKQIPVLARPCLSSAVSVWHTTFVSKVARVEDVMVLCTATSGVVCR